MKTRSFKPKAIKKEWTWVECKLVLHSIDDGVHTYRHLENTYKIIEDMNEVDGILRFNIQMEKSFNYSERVGWNWHKSWRLPQLIVRPTIELKRLSGNQLKCRVMAGYVEDIDTIRSVQLLGTTDCQFNEFVDGFEFNNIKFSETSYKLEGALFHLIIELYTGDSVLQRESSLKSIISPPIFVDSRKSARNTRRFQYQKVTSIVQPFHPFLLKKCLNVRVGSNNQHKTLIKIDDSVAGFNNYLMAQNIRNKCRHPFFMAMKFKSIFRLYFNSLMISKLLRFDQLVKQIQMALVNSVTENKQTSKFNNNKILQIMLNSPIREDDQDVFQQNLLQIENQDIMVNRTGQIDPQWIYLDTNKLINKYSTIYESLAHLDDNIKQNIKDDFEISSDESVSQCCQQFDEGINEQNNKLMNGYSTKLIVQNIVNSIKPSVLTSNRNKKVCM